MKKILYFLIAIIIFTACSKSQAVTDVPAMPPVNKYDIQTVKQYRGIGNGNEYGFYYCDTNADAYLNIKYIDYKAKQEVYLCNRPECRHNNDSCGSFIKPNGNTVTPYIFGGKLCVIYSGAGQAYFDMFGKQALPHIDIMEASGENRKTITELEVNDKIIGNVAFDKNILFVIKQNTAIENQSIKITNYLMVIDLTTGEIIKEIMLDLSSPQLSGSYKEKVYIQNVKSGYKPADSISEIWEFSMLDDSISLNTSWQTKETAGRVDDDKIYLASKNDASIVQYNLQDKSKTDICHIPYDKAHMAGIEQITNEGLSLFYKTKEKEYKPIYIDTTNGNVYTVNLPITVNNKQFVAIPDIVGETSDNFLIAINSYYADVGFISPKGEKSTFTTWKYDFALIDKANYINNVPKYEKINRQTEDI